MHLGGHHVTWHLAIVLEWWKTANWDDTPELRWDKSGSCLCTQVIPSRVQVPPVVWHRIQIGSTLYLWSDIVPPGFCRSQSGLKRSEQSLSASCVQLFVLHPSASSTFICTLKKITSLLLCDWNFPRLTCIFKVSSFSEPGSTTKQKFGWDWSGWDVAFIPLSDSYTTSISDVQDLLICEWRSYDPVGLRSDHRLLHCDFEMSKFVKIIGRPSDEHKCFSVPFPSLTKLPE